jgi:uncharacterized repeat protein (TIGR01451 family)
MTRILKLDAFYAAALVAAAGIGSTIAFAAPANAQSAAKSDVVALSSEAWIERMETAVDGRERAVLKNPTDVVVVPGDKVLFTLKYANTGRVPANGFRATNPMPSAVQFDSVAEDWAEVSVDNGKNWGKLSTLTIRYQAADGTGATSRPANAQDVTHVRWVLTESIAPGASGLVSYRGVIK